MTEKRTQIIEAKLRGEKTDTIILWVNVSKSTIDKVWKRYRATGSGLARAYTGRRSKINPEIEEKIRLEIDENNDITLAELIEKLSLPIGVSRLSQVLIAWGYSFKKKTRHPSAARTAKKVKEKPCISIDTTSQNGYDDSGHLGRQAERRSSCGRGPIQSKQSFDPTVTHTISLAPNG
ncbi:MAG: hypothetical protein RR379_10015 [Clostridia bacterium]